MYVNSGEFRSLLKFMVYLSFSFFVSDFAIIACFKMKISQLGKSNVVYITWHYVNRNLFERRLILDFFVYTMIRKFL